MFTHAPNPIPTTQPLLHLDPNQYSITETTFGGRGDLDGQGTGAVMSYGDLIWTTLSRATSARDAIRVMDELTQLYGYESSGESYGVGDSDEVWLLEMVSKGKFVFQPKPPTKPIPACANTAKEP